MTTVTDILTFWFGDHFEHGMPVTDRSELWFGFNPKNDRLIQDRFEKEVAKAARGDYEAWKESAEGRLALIILLDQFPRNIYRGFQKAFAYDRHALQLCLEGLALEQDKQLIPVYRSFFYLPLEHSESLPLQQRSVDLFRDFHDQAEPVIRAVIKRSLDFAQLHFNIIQQFGRFPHRNEALGRVSTPEEEAFLKSSAVNFGQTNSDS
jgi:uncharacterized protein (DUF924 family)